MYGIPREWLQSIGCAKKIKTRKSIFGDDKTTILDSEGEILEKRLKVGSDQFEDECTKRIHEFRDFRIYNNRKYGYLTIGNLDFSDSCSKKKGGRL